MFFFLFTVYYLGHENDSKVIGPIHSKKAAIHKFPSSTTKTELTTFIGTMIFSSKYFGEFNNLMKPLFHWLQHIVKFQVSI